MFYRTFKYVPMHIVGNTDDIFFNTFAFKIF